MNNKRTLALWKNDRKTETGKVDAGPLEIFLWFIVFPVIILIALLLVFQWHYEDNGKFRKSRIAGKMYYSDNGQWKLQEPGDPNAPLSSRQKDTLRMMQDMSRNQEKIIDKAVESDINFMMRSSIPDLKKYGYIPKDKPVDNKTLEKAFWEYVANGMGPKKKN